MPELKQAVTIIRGESSQDVAGPVGMTLATIMGMLGTPGSRLTLVDGTDVDMDSMLGQDLPSGTVLIAREASQTSAPTWPETSHINERTLPGWGGVLAATSLGFVAATSLMVGKQLFSTTVVVCMAVLMVGLLCSVLACPQVVRSPVGAIVLPGLWGLTALGCVPAGQSWTLALAVPMALNIAFLAAVALWMGVGTGAARIAVVAWGSAAGAGVLIAVLGVPLVAVTATVVSVGAVLIYLLPKLVVSIPESQFVDTPVLAVSAVGVHLPPAQSPRRVLPQWVGHLVGDARHLSDAIAVAVCVGSVMLTAISARLVGVTTLRGTFFYATAGCAILLLWLVPRTGQTRLMRIAPRVAALLLFLILVVNLSGTALAPVGLLTGVAVLIVLVVLCFEVLRRKERISSLERVSDLLRTLALIAIVPCACIGSGLFYWVWEVAG